MVKSNEVKAMLENLDQLTGDFLESEFESTIPAMAISFNGKTIEVPMDYADFNNAATEFLKELFEVCMDYEGYNIGGTKQSQETYRAYYEVMDNYGVVYETFSDDDIKEEDVIEYAENLYLDSLESFDYEISIFHVTERLDSDGQWHKIDEYVVNTYSRKEAYE